MTTASGKLALRYRITYPDGSVHRRSTTTPYHAATVTDEQLSSLRTTAQLIGARIRAGAFDPEEFFDMPERSRATVAQAPRLSGRANLRDAMAAWIDRLEQRKIRPSRLRDYRSHLKLYIGDELGQLEPGRLTRAVLEDFQLWLLSRAGSSGKGLSEQTARNVILATLKAFVRDMDGDLAPFAALRWERQEPTRQQDPLTIAERDAILEHFREKRSFAELVSLELRFQGVTPSEVRGLRVYDFHRADGTLEIRRSRHLGHTGATKTLARERTVDLADDVAADVATIAGIRPGDDWLLEVAEDTLRDHFRAAQVSLGIRERSLYQAKHTYATIALEDGANPADVARHLGISLATLAKHYARRLQRGARIREGRRHAGTA